MPLLILSLVCTTVGTPTWPRPLILSRLWVFGIRHFPELEGVPHANLPNQVFFHYEMFRQDALKQG